MRSWESLAAWVEVIMGISEFLRERDIVLGMPGKGRRSALAGMAARLAKRAGAREGAVLAALLHRERLGSTGIGHGIAVPHARLEGVSAPAAVLARLEAPVWFDAPDGDPVDLLVAVIWPKTDMSGFLPALAGICRLLRSADLRQNLRAAETAAEAHAWLKLSERQPARQPADRQARPAPAWNSRARLATASWHRPWDATRRSPANGTGRADLTPNSVPQKAASKAT